ncbi:DUF3817 domain-containing protein [Paenibacillus hamazuiensis]|uniref:DUF3817 domain-containing protein n=1 Tax=Paenibacillus hamazuiensis TaxID=2936508 RepID=UPI0020109A46|nr:DUF3817 domain-containing protein [Paenibacillus hamazuiensis]
MKKTSVNVLRVVGIIEGISYLLLLFVAMPLKYAANMPEPVRFVGMAHGILFVLFVLALLFVWIRHGWSLLRVIGAFVASLLPFGTFVLDARLRKER